MRGGAAALGRVPWWLVFTLCGGVSTGLYAANVAPLLAYAVVGGGSVVALHVGPRWHRAEPRRPLTLMLAACLIFLIGALIRPAVADHSGVTALAADAFTLPGYLLLIAGLRRLLYARSGTASAALGRHAVIDGLIIGVGAGLASAMLLALPAALIHNRPVMISVLAGLYPLLDVALVVLAVNLAFSTALRQPSFVMLVGVILLILTGDLAYAVIGLDGALAGSRFLDLPFLLAFTTIGAFALHPSVRGIASATPLPVQAWSWQRLLMIGPALGVPFLLIAVVPRMTAVERAVLSVGGVVLVGLLLVRAVSAVQGYAAAQRLYAHQATHDPLTGLPNRRMLTTAVERLGPAGRPAGDERIWMLYLDLDGFKFVNDSWGHPAGDELIVAVGNRLRVAMPESATVARFGGDEFVIVERCGEVAAIDLARRAMGCLADPLVVASAEVVITGSMGISSADPADDVTASADSLMREADIAMYRTKAERRGHWTVFDASMHDAVRERMGVELALRAAVAQEQLHLAYQPIVELTTGWPLGAEALVRWDDPERGPVPPSLFIPIAEDTILITQLGTWVLRESIRRLAAWRRTGVVGDDFWMSINVSPRQLTDAEFPGLVTAELMQAGVPASRIVLEITETVMMQGSDTTERVLRELRELGLRISVDDFGTGFSALSYLRSHPVTGVKIDRSFVSGLGAKAEDSEIVRAIAAMSCALGLSVVAEGVETTVQRDVLAALGVELGQGWLWGRAVGAEEFAQRWAVSPARPSAVGAAGP